MNKDSRPPASDKDRPNKENRPGTTKYFATFQMEVGGKRWERAVSSLKTPLTRSDLSLYTPHRQTIHNNKTTMDSDKRDEHGSSDDHTTNPDLENQQDNENDQTPNKYKDVAKQTSPTQTQTVKDEDILEVDMSAEDDNNVGSATEAMLDTDSLADSQSEDKATKGHKPRRYKQRYPRSYAQMHKSNQDRKGKITIKSLEKTKTHPPVTNKIILQLAEDNKELRKSWKMNPLKAEPKGKQKQSRKANRKSKNLRQKQNI